MFKVEETDKLNLLIVVCKKVDTKDKSKVHFDFVRVTGSQQFKEPNVIEYAFYNIGNVVVLVNGFPLIPNGLTAHFTQSLNVLTNPFNPPLILRLNAGEVDNTVYNIKFTDAGSSSPININTAVNVPL